MNNKTSINLKGRRDTPEQIEACLNCRYEICMPGCIPLVKDPDASRGRARPRMLSAQLDKDGIGKALLRQGLTDGEIAERFHATANAVGKWRRSRGLPPVVRGRRKGRKTCSA